MNYFTFIYNICIYVCVCVCIFICMYVYVHIYMYMYGFDLNSNFNFFVFCFCIRNHYDSIIIELKSDWTAFLVTALSQHWPDMSGVDHNCLAHIKCCLCWVVRSKLCLKLLAENETKQNKQIRLKTNNICGICWDHL